MLLEQEVYNGDNTGFTIRETVAGNFFGSVYCVEAGYFSRIYLFRSWRESVHNAEFYSRVRNIFDPWVEGRKKVEGRRTILKSSYENIEWMTS